MALEEKDKLIGRGRYYVTQLGAHKGRVALTRLVKLLGPVIAHVVSDSKPGTALLAISGDSLRDAMLELSKQISETDLQWFCDTFGEFSTFEDAIGKRPKLTPEFQNTHFAGHYGEMMQWLTFCAEVNFGDFFGVLGLSGGGAALVKE